MSFKKSLLIAMSLTFVSGQRPSFAGSRPIGFPEVIKPTTEGLGNRFGEDDVPTTTIRLPIEAKGDKDLVDRLSKLPVDQQPFWLINWHALEQHRNNPQTFPLKPNVFTDPLPGSSQQQQRPSQQQFSQQQRPSQQQFSQQQNPSNQFSQQTLQQQELALQQQQQSLQQQQQQLSQEQKKFMELQQKFMQEQFMKQQMNNQQLSNRNGFESSNLQSSNFKPVNQETGRFSVHNHNHSGNKPRTPTFDN